MIPFITILGIFVILLARVTSARRAAARHIQPPRANWTWPGWRRPAMWIGALALIFASEAFLPSMPLTGLERPVAAVPHRYLDDLAQLQSVAGPVPRYQDMAQNAPWLWPLGRITSAEMERRLAADLALIETRISQSKDMEEALGSLPAYALPGWVRSATGLGILDAALRRSGSEIDTLFGAQGVSVPVASADRFVMNRLKMASDAATAEATRVYQAAAAARAAYLDARELETGDPADPEFRVLRDAENQAASTLARFNSYTYQIGRYVSPTAGLRPLPDPGALAPQFAAPLILYEDDKTLQVFGGPITDPRAAFSMAGSARTLWQAASGHRRASAKQTDAQRCAVLGAGVQGASNGPAPGTRLCEVAAVLPIDYDLTGTDCAASSLSAGPIEDLVLPGTRIAEGACKEAWIYPHLNVV